MGHACSASLERGCITRSDLFRAHRKRTGLGEPGPVICCLRLSGCSRRTAAHLAKPPVDQMQPTGGVPQVPSPVRALVQHLEPGAHFQVIFLPAALLALQVIITAFFALALASAVETKPGATTNEVASARVRAASSFDMGNPQGYGCGRKEYASGVGLPEVPGGLG